MRHSTPLPSTKHIHNSSRKITLFLLFTLLCLSTLYGCGSGTETNSTAIPSSNTPIATTNYKEGLTILKAVPGEELSGVYIEAGKMIQWEAVRGEPITNADATAPPYVVDIRYTTWRGSPFVVELGGDSPVKASWKQDSSFASEESVQSLLLARNFVDKFEVTEIPSGLEHEKERLINAIRNIGNVDLSTETTSSADPYNAPTAKVIVGSGAQSGNFEHTVEIRKKTVQIPWLKTSIKTPYDHSAIRLTVNSILSNGKKSWVGSFSTANHGTIASDSIMQTKCSKTYRRSNNTIPYLESSDACYSTNYLAWIMLVPATTTVENAAIRALENYFFKTNKPIVTYGYHLCNNDTRIQYAAIRDYNKPSQSSCYTPEYFAPDCN